ncbi:MAG: acyltransferase [Candidatus Eremiobacteraeota bacterium]|nr:acyltransferase [Candidatus Eremiobacteraeota bacterium]
MPRTDSAVSRDDADGLSTIRPRQSRFKKGLANPGAALRYVTARARGRWTILWCRLLGRRVTAGRNFRVAGRLVIRGPGRVIFGDDVNIERVVTPWTNTPEAVIEIGSNSYLNGTRFGCSERITIGPHAILSDASIADTNAHSTHVDRHSPDAPIRVKPVVLEENVWLGSAVGVLPGTRIGRNSVVGYGAVCAGIYPANSIIAGNPARVVKRVPGAPPDTDTPKA